MSWGSRGRRFNPAVPTQVSSPPGTDQRGQRAAGQSSLRTAANTYECSQWFLPIRRLGSSPSERATVSARQHDGYLAADPLSSLASRIWPYRHPQPHCRGDTAQRFRVNKRAHGNMSRSHPGTQCPTPSLPPRALGTLTAFLRARRRRYRYTAAKISISRPGPLCTASTPARLGPPQRSW